LFASGNSCQFAIAIMNSDPLVSVIIPTYNRAGIILRTIDNVFQQTYRKLELIIVDDGSTDDTQAKLRQYGERIRVITQANAGAIASRNRGAEVARGEIIAFQDSDDAWKPTKLARQVALLQRAGSSVSCCLCCADMGVVNGRRQTSFEYSLIRPRHDEGLWLNVADVLATRFVHFNQCAAIRRATFEKLGGFDETLKYLEDYDLPLRLALEGAWAFIQEPLVIYSGPSAGSFSQQAREDLITLKQCELAIYKKTLGIIGHSDQYRKMQRYLKRRARRCRQGLKQIQFGSGRGRVARAVGILLGELSRYEEGFFRRSPWFPKMRTVPLKAAQYLD
jgi:glycosyltransferase involved in cell wall biosynthesis